MNVAEAFTGQPGVYVPVEETINGFREIIEGKYDDLNEQAFYMVGTIDEALMKSRGRTRAEARRKQSSVRRRRGVGSGVGLRPRFDVSLVTPDGAAFEGDAEMLVVPGAW